MRWNLVLGLLVLAFFSGCLGTNVVNNSSSGQINVTTSNGDDNIQSDNQNVDDWCSIGSSYSSSGSDESINIEVIGIELTGEYAGMCHMRQTYESGNESSVIDYYYEKSGNGFQIINVNGDETKVSWRNN